MANLRDILYKAGTTATNGSTDLEVNAVVLDSRQVIPGCVFVAVRGTQTDGHAYIDKAVLGGAVAIVCETLPQTLIEAVTYVKVADASVALAWMACHFYGNPSQGLKLIGITGTNGKTTTVNLLFQLFTALGYQCGLLSTVENRIGTKVVPATHTTPNAVAINTLLAEMRDAGCTHVFMEVSSHAAHQNRIEGLDFAVALFSNITHDHLDYHLTFDAYIKAKKSFFDRLPATSYAIVNKDDRHGMVMVQNTRAKIKTIALQGDADFRARLIENSFEGLHLQLDGADFHCALIGSFNASNLLAAYGAAICLGEEKLAVLTALSAVHAPSGRFDYVQMHQITGIVDYAHTPDALKNVLGTIRDIRKGSERIITVVGCGGDRDRTKRPLMAAIAVDQSDKVILTSDNPRSESPEAILDEMARGVELGQKHRVLRITDRQEAIRTAVSLAQAGDIILVAGKGHETYQEIAGVKHPFDDKRILRSTLETR